MSRETDTNERIKGWHKVTAIAALGLGALTACAPNNTETPEPSSTPVVTETVEPTPTPTATEQVPGPEDMPAELEQYEAMSAADFALLPLSERGPYIDWLTRDSEQLNQMWLEASGNSNDYVPTGDEISVDNTPEEIRAIVFSKIRAAITFHLTGGDGEWVSFTKEEALKVISGAYYDTTRSGYAHSAEWINQAYDEHGYGFSPTVYINQGILEIPDVVSASDVYTVTASDGTQLPARDIAQRSLNTTTNEWISGTNIYVFVGDDWVSFE